VVPGVRPMSEPPSERPDNEDWAGNLWDHNPMLGIYYDRKGQQIDIHEWGRLRHGSDETACDEYVRIGLDVWPPLDPDAAAGPLVSVSTVWLGINHRWGPGPPLIFETMIFGGEHDQGCMRYATEEQAEAGHARVMEDLAAGRTPWFLVDESEDATHD
jgi:hypothetical protein